MRITMRNIKLNSFYFLYVYTTGNLLYLYFSYIPDDMKKDKLPKIEGSFDEIVKASVSGNPAPKQISGQKIKMLKIVHDHLINKKQKS